MMWLHGFQGHLAQTLEGEQTEMSFNLANVCVSSFITNSTDVFDDSADEDTDDSDQESGVAPELVGAKVLCLCYLIQ